jgi:PAS domain S-box-containing protein
MSGGLVALLWLLHARLGRRPFFKWWAWAWTMFALHLAIGALVLPPLADWTRTAAVTVFVATLCGYLQPVLLTFGAISLHSHTQPSPRWRTAALVLAAAAATMAFLASLGLANAIDSFCMRLAPRAWALSAASLVSALAFARHARASRSFAGHGAAAACVLYAAIQAAYGLAAAGRLTSGDAGPLATFFDAQSALRAQLFLVDSVTAYGICLGMVLLLVEEFQRSVYALDESQRSRQLALEENAMLQSEIRERRQAEAALRLSEAKFAAAFRTNPCSVAISTLEDGRILEINDSCEAQTGYLRSELLGRTTLDLGLWVDPAVRSEIVKELRAHGKVANREVRWRSKSGEELTILFSAHTIRMGDQECLLSVAMDVTVHKAVEARHRAILRALPDWIFLTSNQGIYLDCHVKDRANLLAEPETFIGKSLHDVLPPALAREVEQLNERVARTDEEGRLEYSIPIRGELRYYEVRTVRCDADKVLSMVRDVTDTKRAEQQARELRGELAHIGRATTVAALAGSLVHEISQPLTAMRTTAQAALRILAKDPIDAEELRSAITDIIGDSRRVADVIQRMRDMLQRDAPAFAPLDLNKAVAEVVNLVHYDLDIKRVVLERDLGPNLPLVFGDRIQLQQVVVNLLMNACDAVESQPEETRRIRLTTSSQNGTVKLSVSDRGVGLSDEQITRIFEPFYTTKANGMGLGLWICEMILQAHDGRVEVERTAGPGVAFVVRLPVASASGSLATFSTSTTHTPTF